MCHKDLSQIGWNHRNLNTSYALGGIRRQVSSTHPHCCSLSQLHQEFRVFPACKWGHQAAACLLTQVLCDTVGTQSLLQLTEPCRGTREVLAQSVFHLAGISLYAFPAGGRC